jgi:hypothetical protein
MFPTIGNLPFGPLLLCTRYPQVILSIVPLSHGPDAKSYDLSLSSASTSSGVNASSFHSWVAPVMKRKHYYETLFFIHESIDRRQHFVTSYLRTNIDTTLF